MCIRDRSLSVSIPASIMLYIYLLIKTLCKIAKSQLNFVANYNTCERSKRNLKIYFFNKTVFSYFNVDFVEYEFELLRGELVKPLYWNSLSVCLYVRLWHTYLRNH